VQGSAGTKASAKRRASADGTVQPSAAGAAAVHAAIGAAFQQNTDEAFDALLATLQPPADDPAPRLDLQHPETGATALMAAAGRGRGALLRALCPLLPLNRAVDPPPTAVPIATYFHRIATLTDWRAQGPWLTTTTAKSAVCNTICLQATSWTCCSRSALSPALPPTRV
jgi:hypothetical protein